MKAFIKANGIKLPIKGMGEAIKSGVMVVYTKDTGKMTEHMGKEDLFILIKMCIMVNGKKTRLTGMENISILMDLSIKVIGIKINNMVGEKKFGQMVPVLREIMIWGSKVVQEPLCGTMVRNIKENSNSITYQVMGYIIGEMDVFTRENGKII